MEPKFHIKNANGSYSPIISDPKIDLDKDHDAARWFELQSAERTALVAAGMRVS
jgi:hypothetical protein